ncbi:hypothetical protein QWY84_15620 [Aquisalimonas lutea]|nr:hypothetical protein [Aquisalimonas lutea]MDN3519046.1 hypothetical protein [Aquisalimonas lutea]
MTMNHSRKTAALGLAPLLGAGVAGVATAHGMQGMMGGSMVTTAP